MADRISHLHDVSIANVVKRHVMNKHYIAARWLNILHQRASRRVSGSLISSPSKNAASVSTMTSANGS